MKKLKFSPIMSNKMIEKVKDNFQDVELSEQLIELFYHRAIENMNETSDYNLKRLFFQGIKLGVYLSKFRKKTHKNLNSKRIVE